MRKIHLFIVPILIFVFAAGSISAENSIDVRTNANLKTEVRTDAKATGTKSIDADTRVKTNVEANTNKGPNTADVRANLKADFQARIDALTVKRAETDRQREEARNRAEAKRIEVRAQTVEFQASVAAERLANAGRVSLVVIERLESIATRLDSRIAKLKAQGANTAESERFVAAARSDLALARVKVSAFASIDFSTTTAQDNFRRVHALVSEVRELIRSAHKNLTSAVRLLSSVEINAAAEAGVN